jgi:hypothetical protein
MNIKNEIKITYFINFIYSTREAFDTENLSCVLTKKIK